MSRSKPKAKKAKRHITIRLTNEIVKSLDAIADKLGISRTDVITISIKSLLDGSIKVGI